MRLSVAERIILQKRVKFFLGKNASWKRSDLVKQFVSEGYARASIYNVLNKLETHKPTEDKKKTGRPTSWTATRRAKLKRLANNRTGVSQRGLAQKFQVHVSTISRQLAKMDIKYRKREKTPKYDEKQQKRARVASRKLLELLRDSRCQVVMDDEKYFTFSANQMPGNAGYYTNNKHKCSESVRFAGKTKYPPKILVWLAISERGMSRPLFRSQKSAAINFDVYINECLCPRLLPFLRQHHADQNYIFWPDLAPAHYHGATVKWMSEKINFVPKEVNPPNVPQARPIENFWACLAHKVYEGGWEAKTEEQLIRRITAKLKEFEDNFFPSLMKGINGKLKNIVDNGVLSYKK